MNTIKTTPKIAAMMVVVLFGFALIAAPKVHPRKKIMNAMHTRTAGLISWLMVKLLLFLFKEVHEPARKIRDHVNAAIIVLTFACRN